MMVLKILSQREFSGISHFVGNGNQLCDRDSTVGSSIGGSDINDMEEDSIDN